MEVVIIIPSGQEYSHLCVFGVDVLKGEDMSGENFPYPSPQENELDDGSGDGRKTPESFSYDSYTLPSGDSFKKASATGTSSTERGRRDLERDNDDRCIIQIK